MEESEITHVIEVLNKTKEAIKEKNPFKLNELSNQTIHSASIIQDAGSITLAVVVYSLSKLIERGDIKKAKRGDIFEAKTLNYLELASSALGDKNIEAYEKYLELIRKNITSISPNLKGYILEVIRKAAINKASRIYQHGISMGQTAKLLGVSQWELAEYAGQSNQNPGPSDSRNVKERARMALEFFS